MANFQGTARTNYFRVKDKQAFKDAIDHLPDLHLIERQDDDGHTRFAFYSNNPDDGCFPRYITFDDIELTSEDKLPAPFRLSEVIEDIDWNEVENDDGQTVKVIDSITINLPRLISHFLPEGEVAVFMEAGAEKARYVHGWAVAVNHEGRQVQIVLSDIYHYAAEAFGVDKDTITQATY